MFSLLIHDPSAWAIDLRGEGGGNEDSVFTVWTEKGRLVRYLLYLHVFDGLRNSYKVWWDIQKNMAH